MSLYKGRMFGFIVLSILPNQNADEETPWQQRDDLELFGVRHDLARSAPLTLLLSRSGHI